MTRGTPDERRTLDGDDPDERADSMKNPTDARESSVAVSKLADITLTPE
jgi:hypothetical protein